MASDKKQLKQAIRTEFLKCAQDPVYFLRKYCVIQHPQEGKIKFNLYDYCLLYTSPSPRDRG